MSTWNKHYHWKTKGCTSWSKQYFTDNLVGKQVVTLPSGAQLKVDRVDSFEGDVELGNRKGKLITIYDVDMGLSWVAVEAGAGDASSSDSSEKIIAKGKLRFPEVSHEIEDQGDEYTWETTLDHDLGEGDASAKQAAYAAVKKDLVKKILPVIEKFRSTLIEAHARDLGHDESANNSGTSTPAQAPAAPASTAAKTPSAPATATSASKKGVTVSQDAVELEGRNACSKEDLWDLLTNQARIPMWTRAPAQFVPLPSHTFSLFNGNVTGTVTSASSPNELIMSWRPPTWQPADHYGTLKLSLHQEDEATLLRINLTGVPEGEEENSKKALDEFYLNGLRRLGLGSMI